MQRELATSQNPLFSPQDIEQRFCEEFKIVCSEVREASQGQCTFELQFYQEHEVNRWTRLKGFRCGSVGGEIETLYWKD